MKTLLKDKHLTHTQHTPTDNSLLPGMENSNSQGIRMMMMIPPILILSATYVPSLSYSFIYINSFHFHNNL